MDVDGMINNIEKFIDFNKYVDLSNYLDDSSKVKARYQLYATIVHNGESLDYGHYVMNFKDVRNI
jgi:uncharacterized UBP type Zn finger protein